MNCKECNIIHCKMRDLKSELHNKALDLRTNQTTFDEFDTTALAILKRTRSDSDVQCIADNK